MRTTVLLALAGVAVLYAQSPEAVQLSNTQSIEFPAGGTLRLTHALGVVTVIGWDQPQVEITTIKSSKGPVDAKNRDRMTKLLDAVKITAERKGDEVVVASAYPKHPAIERPFLGLTDFTLEYRIHVPRGAKLAIEQDMGETNVSQIAGDIGVEGHMGQINVQLREGEYSIDARTKVGSVYSDFAGADRARRWIGHAFLANPASPRQRLMLHLSYGDIVVTKSN